MNFDLWTFFVEQIFGGFIIAVLGIALLLFLILSVFGRLSKVTIFNYILLFIFVMSLGYGYEVITIPLAFLILYSFYIAIKNYGAN